MGEEYLLDDEGVLWYAPKGEHPKLAIPRVMIPGVLALVHSTLAIQAWRAQLYSSRVSTAGRRWSRMCASMCSRMAIGEGNEQEVSCHYAREVLRPWELLEMDIQDFKQ